MSRLKTIFLSVAIVSFLSPILSIIFAAAAAVLAIDFVNQTEHKALYSSPPSFSLIFVGYVIHVLFSLPFIAIFGTAFKLLKPRTNSYLTITIFALISALVILTGEIGIVGWESVKTHMTLQYFVMWHCLTSSFIFYFTMQRLDRNEQNWPS
jgi:hypothetical protein